MMMSTLRPAVLVLIVLAPLLARGQPADTTSMSEACRGASYRAFDFWIGEWVVRDSTGGRVGASHISAIARGCGLREEWAGTSGSRGTSLNYYDASDARWHQEWVGSSGLILHLSGGLRDGVMVLEGTRAGEDGPIRDRIRWRPLSDGRVRQEWSTSTDGGETWEQVFLGFYEAAPAEPDP